MGRIVTRCKLIDQGFTSSCQCCATILRLKGSRLHWTGALEAPSAPQGAELNSDSKPLAPGMRWSAGPLFRHRRLDRVAVSLNRHTFNIIHHMNSGRVAESTGYAVEP